MAKRSSRAARAPREIWELIHHLENHARGFKAGEITAKVLAQDFLRVKAWLKNSDAHFSYAVTLRNFFQLYFRDIFGRLSPDLVLASLEILAFPEEFKYGKYRFHVDTFSHWPKIWAEHLPHLTSAKERHILEIGCEEGYSTLFMLENYAKNRKSTVTTIDPMRANSRGTFYANLQRAKRAFQVIVYVGKSQTVLPKLRSRAKFSRPKFKGYDLIYVDGEHRLAAVLRDAQLCWPLLNAGGAIIFDDFGNAQYGLSTPVLAWAKKKKDAVILHRGYQLILRKI